MDRDDFFICGLVSYVSLLLMLIGRQVYRDIKNRRAILAERKTKEPQMLDIEIKYEIQYLVQQKVIGREAFTAYDITQALRVMDIKCRHEDVKAIVHGIFDDHEMGGYTRNLRDMGGNGPAWYYFHTSDYASQQYASVNMPASVNTGPVLGKTATLPCTSFHRPQPVTGGVIIAKTDARQTVCVPSCAIKELELEPGDEVTVCPLPNEFGILIRPVGKGRDLISGKARFYTVDRDHNIRFTKGALVDAGLSAQVFNVEVEKEEIILRPGK